MSSRQAKETVLGGGRALEVRGVSLRFGGVRALTDVSFAVDDGELFSIIGPNGAGKTSIVNCISGRYRPTEGRLFYRGTRHHRRSIPTPGRASASAAPSRTSRCSTT